MGKLIKTICIIKTIDETIITQNIIYTTMLIEIKQIPITEHTEVCQHIKYFTFPVNQNYTWKVQ